MKQWRYRAPEGGAPPRKRTRRGSRGGRNRKRKTPTAAAKAGDDASLATVEAEPDAAEARDEPARGDGYVPMSEWIDEIEERET